MRRLLILATLAAAVAFGQTGLLTIQNGTIDFAGAVHTLPTVVVANVPGLPALCTPGELAMVTSATPGQMMYQCGPLNVWTQQLNSGSSGGGGITVYSADFDLAGAAHYYPIGGGLAPQLTESSAYTRSPQAATMTNLQVQLSADPGMGITLTVTLRKAGASQSLTCTITGDGATQTACSDTINSTNVSQGDVLDYLVTPSGMTGALHFIITAQFGNITQTGSVNTGVAQELAYYPANGAAVGSSGVITQNNGVFANFADETVTSYASSGGTATLSVASSRIQVATGTATPTFKLPNATTLVQTGSIWYFVNSSSASMPVQDSTAAAITTVPALGAVAVINTSISTAAGTWEVRYLVPVSIPAHNVVGNNTGSAAVPNTVRLACADLSDSSTGCTGAAASANSLIRGIGASFDGGGSALTTSKVAYVVVRFGCTIAGYSVWADTGTIDFDVWKIASGTAIPTVANTIISGTSYLALASGTALISTSTASLTTTTSTADDIYGFKIHAVSGATLAGVSLKCNAS